ncbi:ABC transporter permease [Paenibacillus sp. KN14-4R]|uniref:ABC transporter permease n=1 Tax=Paenibacillus sp. KN14-4R TaxID=3445773 RepID=UPI003FA196FB
MLHSYLLRSIRELRRFKGRNVIALVGMTVMVVLLTTLFTILVRIDTVFEQDNLEATQRLQMIHVSGTFNEDKVKEIKAMDGVEHVIAYKTFGYPWTHFNIGDMEVLPVMVAYYDPISSSFFTDTKLMKQTMDGESGAIIPSNFSTNMMSLDQYQKSFGVQKPGPLETLETSTGKLIKQYQDILLSKDDKSSIPLVGQTLNLSIEHKFFEEAMGNVPKNSSFPITGQLKPEMLGIKGNVILIPAKEKNKIVDLSVASSYDTVIVKPKSIADVDQVVNQLKAKKYAPFNPIDMLKFNMDGRKAFITKIIVIMSIILLIAILSFTNTFHSSIQERSRDIGLRKALGGSYLQIIVGFVLEGMILVILALGIGFLLASVGLGVLNNLIQTGSIDPAYYQSFDLDRSTIEYVLDIPMQIFAGVTVGMLMLGFLASFIPARSSVVKSYASLMKRG